MAVFMAAVILRLRLETSATSTMAVDPWLFRMLEQKDWWLRATRALFVCKMLNMENVAEEFYYRDVYVWLPDVRWGKECMPCCPTCRTNTHVGPHDLRLDHVGRRITDMNTHYFVVGKRYKCKHCEQQAKDIGSKLARQVGGGSVHGKVGNQTFGGYDRTTLTLFPHAKGERFPAVLSHKGGISKELLRWTTMLFDAGVRPHRLSTILLAQHTARHSDD